VLPDAVDGKAPTHGRVQVDDDYNHTHDVAGADVAGANADDPEPPVLLADLSPGAYALKPETFTFVFKKQVPQHFAHDIETDKDGCVSLAIKRTGLKLRLRYCSTGHGVRCNVPFTDGWQDRVRFASRTVRCAL
jgi:hypothetical protein